jgi:hypothetical protein
MSVAQTLPNQPTYPLWISRNQQSYNAQISLECAQTRLTSAQLLSLKTTPIVVTPSPTITGEALFLHGLMLKYNFNTTAYTLNGGTFKLYYGPVANGHAITADLSTGFLTATSNHVSANIQTLVASDVTANIINLPLYAVNDGAANYTLGDATVDVTVLFARTTP